MQWVRVVLIVKVKMDRKIARNWKDILRLSICDYLDFDNTLSIMVIWYVLYIIIINHLLKNQKTFFLYFRQCETRSSITPSCISASSRIIEEWFRIYNRSLVETGNGKCGFHLQRFRWTFQIFRGNVPSILLN